ncbi:potassium channel family protein [Labrys okinawensis]|uniref:potassium channel family protein n=1 Tax=Labrys okinawensis TaxID=346911 RepID=UPI0039BD7E88
MPTALNLKNTLQQPFGIGVIYILTLLSFSIVYYYMPDEDFYHSSILYEPATVEHKKRLEEILNKDFNIERYPSSPGNIFVDSSHAYNFNYGFDEIRFSIYYYYYEDADSEREWAAIQDKCGKSERNSTFYKRTVVLDIQMSASSGQIPHTVHAIPQGDMSSCDREILSDRYKDLEITKQGFQAMVDITPEANDLLIAVSEEQLGHAPHQFWYDRATRMVYFSISAITTTGFGDILPMTATARLITAVESLLGIFLAGAFVNAVSNIKAKSVQTGVEPTT